MRDTTPSPASKLSQGTKILQTVPSQLPPGEDTEVTSLATLEELKLLSAFSRFFPLLAYCVPVYGKDTLRQVVKPVVAHLPLPIVYPQHSDSLTGAGIDGIHQPK
jgi:hypothetical protein